MKTRTEKKSVSRSGDRDSRIKTDEDREVRRDLVRRLASSNVLDRLA